MARVFLSLLRPIRFRYLDTAHAALVMALRGCGMVEHHLIGPSALPWTFAVSGSTEVGGLVRASGFTLSTPNPELADAMLRLKDAVVRVQSVNGDLIEFAGATPRVLILPLHPDQTSLAVGFASPFLVSLQNRSKQYARALQGLDLSAAFSAGLSRRLGRPISLRVEQDRLSATTEGTAPRLIRVRRTGTRDLILPALSAILTLHGSAVDLRDAFLAGLGEKTRYGFGCPVALA